ncbi:MAG: SDR family oxidoreductase [Phycisphaerales bacterium]
MARVDLKDKPILIAGASSGIGRATAVACARAGMPVVCGARRVDRLDELVREIEGFGGSATACAMDVTDQDDCDRAVRVTVDTYGSLYSVFANAGYGVERAVHLTTDDELRAMFEVNLFGTMNVLRPATPLLLEQGAGHVLICSSSIGKIGVPYFGAYCATKGAQWLLGQSMRCELRSRGVFVSTVHPVGTKTEFFDKAEELSGGRSSLDSHAPDFAMQSAETVASAIVRALRTGKREIWPSWSRLVRLGIAMGNAFPFFADQGMKKIAREGRRSEPDG